MTTRTISTAQQHAVVPQARQRKGSSRKSTRKTSAPGAKGVGSMKRKSSMRSDSSGTTTSSSSSKHRRVSFDVADDYTENYLSQPMITPAKLLLMHAKRAGAISKASIMDIILDARSFDSTTHAPEREEPLLEALDLYRRHRVPIPDARAYVFNDLNSLDIYWQQQGAFLKGITSYEDEDWSKLITLANVSAERSTAEWNEDSEGSDFRATCEA